MTVPVVPEDPPIGHGEQPEEEAGVPSYPDQVFHNSMRAKAMDALLNALVRTFCPLRK